MGKDNDKYGGIFLLALAGLGIYALTRTGSKYRRGDILVYIGEGVYFTTVLEAYEGKYVIQDGIWPNVYGYPEVVDMSSIDDGDLILYTHIEIVGALVNDYGPQG